MYKFISNKVFLYYLVDKEMVQFHLFEKYLKFYLKKLSFNYKPKRYYSDVKIPDYLDFDSFYSVYKYIDPKWLAWFIGFTEGDGGLHVYNNKCLFAITQSEESVLLEIKSVLGFGKVYFDSSVNSFRYRVYDQSYILILANLFNGKFASKNKIEQLGNWIKVLNKKSEVLVHNYNPFKPTLNDAWLSGFTDAEGCFYVSVVNQKANITTTNPKGKEEIVEKIYSRVRLRFNLDQKDELLLIHIKNLFGFGSVNKTSDPGIFKYTNGSFKSNAVTVNYFESFPLKTKKQEAFRKWSEIRIILLAKEHLLPGGIERIRELAKFINN
uniref:Homing endonuclease LAGLIDADG domain-containing protein n=1 Tax=Orbilia brochopaga TaxID=3140254 RepID=A0A4Y5MV21_9PEZI|nr:hypothetical protein [Drechslerella brochopaga]